MPPLEDKMKLIKAYKEDEAMDQEVGDIIPDLGCTRNMDTKFYRTMELY